MKQTDQQLFIFWIHQFVSLTKFVVNTSKFLFKKKKNYYTCNNSQQWRSLCTGKSQFIRRRRDAQIYRGNLIYGLDYQREYGNRKQQYDYNIGYRGNIFSIDSIFYFLITYSFASFISTLFRGFSSFFFLFFFKWKHSRDEQWPLEVDFVTRKDVNVKIVLPRVAEWKKLMKGKD